MKALISALFVLVLQHLEGRGREVTVGLAMGPPGEQRLVIGIFHSGIFGEEQQARV
jgi:hypothetical protein